MEEIRSYKSSFRFNAIHNISDDVTKKHPHTFFLTVYMLVEGEDHDKDYFTIEKQIEDYAVYLQGKDINELFFSNEKTATLENMGMYLYYFIKALIKTPHVNFLELELGDSQLSKIAVGDVAVVGSMNMYIPTKKINQYFDILKGK